MPKWINHSLLDTIIGATVAFIISGVIYFYNYPSKASTVPVAKVAEPAVAKPVIVATDVIYKTSQTRVNEKAFCKFGYQFLSTILSTERNYGVSISTIQVMESYNGASIPMKCKE